MLAQGESLPHWSGEALQPCFTDSLIERIFLSAVDTIDATVYITNYVLIFLGMLQFQTVRKSNLAWVVVWISCTNRKAKVKRLISIQPLQCASEFSIQAKFDIQII